MTTCPNLVLSFLLSRVSLECRPPSCPPLHSPLHPLSHHGQHLHSIISTKSPCILNLNPTFILSTAWIFTIITWWRWGIWTFLLFQNKFRSSFDPSILQPRHGFLIIMNCHFWSNSFKKKKLLSSTDIESLTFTLDHHPWLSSISSIPFSIEMRFKNSVKLFSLNYLVTNPSTDLSGTRDNASHLFVPPPITSSLGLSISICWNTKLVSLSAEW